MRVIFLSYVGRSTKKMVLMQYLDSWKRVYTDLPGLENVRQSIIKTRKTELKSEFKKLGRDHFLALQKRLADVTEQMIKDECGYDKRGGPLQPSGQNAREFTIGDDARRTDIDRAGKCFMFNDEMHDIHQIPQMYPGKPLTPAAQAAAKKCPEKRFHNSQGAAILMKHESETGYNHSFFG